MLCLYSFTMFFLAKGIKNTLKKQSNEATQQLKVIFSQLLETVKECLPRLFIFYCLTLNLSLKDCVNSLISLMTG